MLTTVDNAAALTAALKAATAGDTILLAPGNYAVSITNVAAGGVTITSLDVTRPAVVTSLNMNGSSGLTFQDLEFHANAAGGDNAFRVQGSQDITFRRLDVHGSLDGNPQNDVSGFLVRSSQNITIQDSEFHELSRAVSHLGVDRFTVTGNYFHDLRSDGVLGGGSSWVTIAGNRFTDFYPVAGDHPDAVQFWTANTTTNAHDIRVVGNIITRGAGAVMQGVFMGDEVAGVFYERVVIEDNLVSGSMYHGITVGSGLDVTIRNNVVQGYSDMRSWIRVENVDRATIADNTASLVTVTADSKNVTQLGTTIVGQASDGGAWAMAAWRQAQEGAARAPSEAVQGGAARDVLFGDGAADRILGGGDNDVIIDSSGNNYLRGEDGDDVILGGFDFDDIHGNAGADTALGGSGDDWVVGGKDNDSLSGEAGGDLVYGNLGNDTLDGGAGADTMRGGQDNDLISGGAGDDFLSGDKGSDTLTGGTGADTFYSFGETGLDVITFFNAAEGDRVKLEPGTTYTVLQVGPDVVVSLSGGGQLVLTGTLLTNLGDGWIGF